jgi:hypothetical protein
MSLWMNRRLLIAATLLGLVATLAIALWVSQRVGEHHSGQVDCGTAVDTEPWVFNCLMNAYPQGRLAKGRIVSPTLEGDIVVYTLTVISPTSLKVVVDNRDRYGQPGLYTYTCSGMSRMAPTPGVEHYGLSLNGCAGNGPLSQGATLNVPS